MKAFRGIGRLGRMALAGGAALAVAGCAGGTGPGGTGAGGIGNPLSRLTSPFSGIGPVDPDLRGRIGGPLDTSGAVAGGAVPGGAAVAPGGVRDPFAGEGVRAPRIEPAAGAAPAPSAGGASASPGSSNAPAPSAGARSHTVAAGETAWSISRKYGVAVADLASANALPEAMTVRVGQRLAIPAAGARTAQAVTAPGVGSPTPTPPSASKPLPDEKTTPKSQPVAKPEGPNLGATRTAASGSGRFSMPVNGSIVRAYAKGKNEGIDISAPGGTTVKAAGAGTVAAITRDTDGVPIVVIRHDGSLMTVYAGLDGLTVGKGDSVSAGQAIGKATAAGVVHFEVRQGFESVDPEGYLG